MEDISRVVRELVTAVAPYAEEFRLSVNGWCAGLEAWQIIAYTVGISLLLLSIYNFIFDDERSIKDRVKRCMFDFVEGLPIIRGMIARELEKQTIEAEEGYQKGTEGLPYVHKLPANGLSRTEVKQEIGKYQSIEKPDWNKGLVSGAVYNGGAELTDLLVEVYHEFAWTNPLHPDLFPGVRKMEAEIARMACGMFNGGPQTCGSVTSGGTESILLACMAYRNMAKAKGVKYPEIIAPATAHAAFDKAADMFHMKITHIPIDPVTCKVNIGKMRRAINGSTCMLVGSAPQFPHGSVDPMEEIAALGLRYNIPVHTDSCLGGFLVPFMEKAGFDVPKVDFRVPGITSISADSHKYGFAPKGTSVIMYSDKKYRRHQYFIYTDWPGGIYGSPTLAGSRSGAVIASCWAAMMHFGESGYVESTKKIIGTTRYITQELRKIEKIHIMGDPQVSVIALGSKHFDIFRLADALANKGWSLNPLQFPSGIHICVTLIHTRDGVADAFIKALRSCVEEILKDPKAKCNGSMGAIYGTSQMIPDRSMVKVIGNRVMDALYSTGESDIQQSNGVKK